MMTGTLGTLVPIILMFAVLYFLLIRPQQKQQKLYAKCKRNWKRRFSSDNRGIALREAAVGDTLSLTASKAQDWSVTISVFRNGSENIRQKAPTCCLFLRNGLFPALIIGKACWLRGPLKTNALSQPAIVPVQIRIMNLQVIAWLLIHGGVYLLKAAGKKA